MNIKSFFLGFVFLGSSAAYADFTGSVVDILDGGRVVVNTSDQLVVVKLNAIMLPFPNQNMYQQSRQIFENLMMNKDVVIKTKNQIGDRCIYGEAYSGGVNMNEAMLLTGFSWIYNENTATPNYFLIEENSKLNKIGLWNPEYHFKFNDITLTPEMMIHDCIATGLGNTPESDQTGFMNESNRAGLSSAISVMLKSFIFAIVFWFGFHYLNEHGYKYIRKPFSDMLNKKNK